MKITLVAMSLAMLVKATTVACQSPVLLANEVREAENAFASTMARRDLSAFAEFVADEAVFFGDSTALRGKMAVIEGWRPLFEGANAPFSWESEVVEVLDSGRLALSSGPVRNRAGQRVGTFNSVWRREADGRWRVVFDKGCPVCNCARTP